MGYTSTGSDHKQRQYNGKFLEELRKDSRKRVPWTSSDKVAMLKWLARGRHSKDTLRDDDASLRQLAQGIGIRTEILSKAHSKLLKRKLLGSLEYTLGTLLQAGKVSEYWDPLADKKRLHWPDDMVSEILGVDHATEGRTMAQTISTAVQAVLHNLGLNDDRSMNEMPARQPREGVGKRSVVQEVLDSSDDDDDDEFDHPLDAEGDIVMGDQVSSTPSVPPDQSAKSTVQPPAVPDKVPRVQPQGEFDPKDIEAAIHLSLNASDRQNQYFQPQTQKPSAQGFDLASPQLNSQSYPQPQSSHFHDNSAQNARFSPYTDAVQAEYAQNKIQLAQLEAQQNELRKKWEQIESERQEQCRIWQQYQADCQAAQELANIRDTELKRKTEEQDKRERALKAQEQQTEKELARVQQEYKDKQEAMRRAYQQELDRHKKQLSERQQHISEPLSLRTAVRPPSPHPQTQLQQQQRPRPYSPPWSESGSPRPRRSVLAGLKGSIFAPHASVSPQPVQQTSGLFPEMLSATLEVPAVESPDMESHRRRLQMLLKPPVPGSVTSATGHVVYDQPDSPASHPAQTWHEHRGLSLSVMERMPADPSVAGGGQSDVQHSRNTFTVPDSESDLDSDVDSDSDDDGFGGQVTPRPSSASGLPVSSEYQTPSSGQQMPVWSSSFVSSSVRKALNDRLDQRRTGGDSGSHTGGAMPLLTTSWSPPVLPTLRLDRIRGQSDHGSEVNTAATPSPSILAILEQRARDKGAERQPSVATEPQRLAGPSPSITAALASINKNRPDKSHGNADGGGSGANTPRASPSTVITGRQESSMQKPPETHNHLDDPFTQPALQVGISPSVLTRIRPGKAKVDDSRAKTAPFEESEEFDEFSQSRGSSNSLLSVLDEDEDEDDTAAAGWGDSDADLDRPIVSNYGEHSASTPTDSNIEHRHTQTEALLGPYGTVGLVQNPLHPEDLEQHKADMSQMVDIASATLRWSMQPDDNTEKANALAYWSRRYEDVGLKLDPESGLLHSLLARCFPQGGVLIGDTDEDCSTV